MNTGSSLRPLVLLDRDGTINAEVDYLSRPEQLRLLPGVLTGLAKLCIEGVPVVVVSNQSGVGRGYFSERRLAVIHHRLEAMLAEGGVDLAGIFYCPHRPDQACDCRKPKPGLAMRAAEVLKGELNQSFVVGDKPCDIELGKNIGASTILVRTGYGVHYDISTAPTPDVVVDNLDEASAWILNKLQS